MKDPGLSPDHFHRDEILSTETLLDNWDEVRVEGGLSEGALFRSDKSGKLTLILPLPEKDLSRFNRLSVKVLSRSSGCLLVGMRLLHGSNAEGGSTPYWSFSGGREELWPDGPREFKFPMESFGSYGFPKGWSDVRCIEMTFWRERTHRGPKEIAVDMIGLEGETREIPSGARLTQEGLASLSTADLSETVLDWLAPYVSGNPALFIPTPHSFPRESAEEVLSGRIMGQDLGLPIPWDANPVGAQEWTHFLNRHHFMRSLVQAPAETGDGPYAVCLDAMVSSWIRQNPAPLGSNGGAGPAWETLSAAWRLREWLWIAGIAWPSQSFRRSTRTDMLCSIWEHARHLVDHRGHPNNWIIVESAALTLAGLCFSQFREAEEWVETGLERLVREFRRQFFSDGVHFEISPLYHSICLDAFLEVKETAAAKGKGLPAEFDAPLEKCVSYLAALCRPDFTWPALNDSNGVGGDYTAHVGRAGRVFRRQDFQWIGSRGRTGKPPDALSKAFPEAGIAVMRSDFSTAGNFLVFRAGPSGAAHVHGDSLSLDVAAMGAARVVDPGISGYAPGPFTDYYRSAFSHTMILIDGEGPERVGVEFHDRIRPAGYDFSWTTDGRVDTATGVCRGPWHGESSGSAVLRTVIFVRPDYWVVRDVIRGNGFNEISACWQLMPGRVDLDEDSLAVTLVDERGLGLRLIPVFNLDVLGTAIEGEQTGESDPTRLSQSSPTGQISRTVILSNRLTTGSDKESDHGLSRHTRAERRLCVELIAGSSDPPRGWVSLNGADVPATHCSYRFSGQLPLTAIWLLAPFSTLPRPRIGSKRMDREDGSVSLEIDFPDRHTDAIVLGPPPVDSRAGEKEPLHGSVEFTRRGRR